MTEVNPFPALLVTVVPLPCLLLLMAPFNADADDI